MAKITYYPKVTKLTDEDIFLIDGADGTRTVKTKDLATELQNRLNVDVYDYLDKMNIPVEMRRNIFRGKNLGSSYTSDQKARVADGSFKGFFIGDYWYKNNFRWRIVDINYWLYTGNISDNRRLRQHLVIIPDQCLYSNKMNDTPITDGGYLNSLMYKQNLQDAKNMVDNAFGLLNVYNHREIFVNAMVDGRSSGAIWNDSLVDLPTLCMVAGDNMYEFGTDGNYIPVINGANNAQLSLMKLYPSYINYNTAWYWLRDPVSASSFACLNWYGNIGYNIANSVLGVRPVFGIIG